MADIDKSVTKSRMTKTNSKDDSKLGNRFGKSEENLKENVARVSRKTKCDVRCAASSCPRHRHGVKRHSGDLASLLRFSRELLLKTQDLQDDTPPLRRLGLVVNKVEEKLGNGDCDDEIQDTPIWDTDPFDMLKSTMDQLKPEVVDQKYDAENNKHPFPQFDPVIPEEEDSVFSDMDSDSDKQEIEYQSRAWRCTSSIGVQTEPSMCSKKARNNHLSSAGQTHTSIKNTNSVIIPVNSNMQLSITVVPMQLNQINPESIKLFQRHNSAGDSPSPKEHEEDTNRDNLKLILENCEQEAEKINQNENEEEDNRLSPVSVSDTLVNNEKGYYDQQNDDDTLSVGSKTTCNTQDIDNYLEFPMSARQSAKIRTASLEKCEGIDGRYGDCSAILQPQKFEKAMRYKTHNLQTRCVRTMSQVRKQFQREFAPLHDELSYIQNRVRCIFRYTNGLDAMAKIPEEVKRSAVLSTLFRRGDPFGEPETKRSWPDHIRKFPSCSVCSSFSAVMMPKGKKSSENLWKKESSQQRTMAISPYKNESRERRKYVRPVDQCNSTTSSSPPRPLISVTLDGSTYTSQQSAPRPVTPPLLDNPSRKEAFFSSTISYFLDNRARHQESSRRARKYCSEKVCSWRTPHSKRDFVLQTKRHGLDGASSVSTLSALPSDHTISVASVKCSQGIDGRVVYE